MTLYTAFYDMDTNCVNAWLTDRHGSRMNYLCNNLFQILIIICTMPAPASNGHFIVHVFENIQIMKSQFAVL